MGDLLCPHLKWRQENSVPARFAFTQCGGEKLSLLGFAHTQYGGQGTDMLIFYCSVSARSTPGVKTSRTSFEFRRVAPYVTGGGSGKEFVIWFVSSGEEGAAGRAASVSRSEQPLGFQPFTFDSRLCPIFASELLTGLEPLSTSASSGDACDQAR